MPTDLTYLAGDTDLHPLWQAIHDRLCAGTTPETLTTVRVTDMNHAGLAQLRTWLDTTTRRRRRTSAVTATGDTVAVPVRDLLTALDLIPGQLVTIVELAGLGEHDTDIRTTIAALDTVLKQLPVNPPEPLAKLAHDTVGDPHYFDLDRLAGRRLVAAIAEHTGRAIPV